MDGIARRTIHTIGEPIVRFREDPIRILRAIKFAARLDLGIEPDVYDAMVSCREELAKAARPRVFEEIMRLMRGGAAHRSMWLMWEIGAMAILLPELAAFLDDHESTDGGADCFWRKLDAVDRLTKQRGKPLDDIVLWATLLSEPLEESETGYQDRGEAAADFLEPIVDRIAMPRRVSDAIRRIRTMLPRLAQGKGGRLLKNEVARDALEVLEIDSRPRGRASTRSSRCGKKPARSRRPSSREPGGGWGDSVAGDLARHGDPPGQQGSVVVSVAGRNAASYCGRT